MLLKNAEIVPAKLLGESVEESRAKRLEKQKSRYRDRGGTFIPAETNPLLDILLARGVNGESPTKLVTRKPSISPRKDISGEEQQQKSSKPAARKGRANANANASAVKPSSSKAKSKASDVKASTSKAKLKAPAVKPSTSKAKSKAVTKPHDADAEVGQPIAGPSRLREDQPVKKATARPRRKIDHAPAVDACSEGEDAVVSSVRKVAHDPMSEGTTASREQTTLSKAAEFVVDRKRGEKHSDNDANEDSVPVARKKNVRKPSAVRTGREKNTTIAVNNGEAINGVVDDVGTEAPELQIRSGRGKGRARVRSKDVASGEVDVEMEMEISNPGTRTKGGKDITSEKQDMGLKADLKQDTTGRGRKGDFKSEKGRKATVDEIEKISGPKKGGRATRQLSQQNKEDAQKSRLTSQSANMKEAVENTAARDDSPRSSKPRLKRPLPIIDSDEDEIRQPPQPSLARKRPQPYVPSDDEDDIPIQRTAVHKRSQDSAHGKHDTDHPASAQLPAARLAKRARTDTGDRSALGGQSAEELKVSNGKLRITESLAAQARDIQYPCNGPIGCSPHRDAHAKRSVKPAMSKGVEMGTSEDTSRAAKLIQEEPRKGAVSRKRLREEHVVEPLEETAIPEPPPSRQRGQRSKRKKVAETKISEADFAVPLRAEAEYEPKSSDGKTLKEEEPRTGNSRR
ncbi:hypothetical protein PHLCEN_2v897 [Hermanssonia centrifuga]|uniref:Uncharacterized protein n=1 Tax=Hermanssonia centrifuga TaxID=98765 RepID=A0A2R6S4W5_9APHY|nr:hypothetical protein PHLCEN_2v897 [Hermanssonia centrifuga]